MKKIKNTIAKLILSALAAVLFLGCPANFDMNDLGDKSLVTIDTGLDLANGKARSLSDVASFRLTVSATDLETKSFDFSSASIDLEIEAGTARTFQLDALDSNGTAIYTGSTTTDLNAGSTVNLAIQMEAVSFTVTFNSNGGSAVTSQTVSTDGLIINPLPPTKSGYNFAGWYTDSGLTTLWNFTSDTVKGNMTLYARWSTSVVYTVTFNTNGGSAIADQQISDGGTVSDPGAPAKAGCTFGGWFSDVGLTNSWNFISDTVTGSLTLYAKWDVITYTISYVLNGGVNAANPTTYTVDVPITLNDPTYSGWTFTGWYSDSSFTTPVNSGVTGLTGNLTLYAKWSVVYSGELTISSQESLVRGAGYYADYWAISFTNTTTVTIDIMGDNGGLGDTWIGFHDSSSLLFSNDDGGEGVNARLVDVTLTGGQPYYIEATTYSSGITGTYTIELSAVPDSMTLLTNLPY